MGEKQENDEVEQSETQVSDWELPLSFTKNRHIENIEGVNAISQTWRMKERMKTVSVALVLCLNVGVDPPDIVKTQPCARLECWIDPLSMSPPKALETVGTTLQKQYERWQPRARYKQSLDPTVEEVKKLCTSLRRNAKEERVLFHYNGHGVPKPTENGEIWVFNRTYTQYIPLSVYDLQTWMGAPSIYVYDCSCAGTIVKSFKSFAEQHKNEYEMQKSASGGRAQSPSPPCYQNCIQLAACGPKEILPMNPELPADIFTACLTTPIKVALRWFVMQNTSKLVPKITLDLVDKIPGQLNDRRTMLGELNWIFTAITDTIAWNTLPRDLFQKLFRQDLLVASLFRNFLLAERVLRSYDCTPMSSPALPPTYQHPMWQAWDLALDLSLSQLPGVLAKEESFVHLPFFEEQLTAFQVWLKLGSENRNPPEQLPIVLQVLLSQVHRLRALELLGKFLDLGPWAVNLALSVGIFPYVLKLLQSSAKELRPLLVFIWAKILAVDSTCQADLVRDNGHKYFLSILQDTTVHSEYRTLSAFVLASIVHEYPAGQKAALQGSLVSICLDQLTDPSSRLRQWLAICLARLWDNHEKARWTGVRDIAHEKLYTLLQDPCPEVRAAAVYALGTFINSVSERSEHANNIDHSIAMTLLNTVTSDMSYLVRQELVVALQWIVLLFESSFISVAMQEGKDGSPYQEIMSPVGMRRAGSRDRLSHRMLTPQFLTEHFDGHGDKLKRVSSSSSICSMSTYHTIGPGSNLGTLPTLAYGSVYMKLWNGLTNLDVDPHPLVIQLSQIVTNHIRNQVKDINLHKEYIDLGRLTSSVSLPPSPNRGGNFLTGESPPTLHPQNEVRLEKRSSLVNRNITNRKVPNTINEESDENVGNRKPLVQTQYVAWACKHFAQPVKKEADEEDFESPIHYEKEWRYMRNAALRREALDEQDRINAVRLENQVFNTRNPYPPTVIQFHPYDQQIAVADRDHFGIWDWGTGAKITYWASKGSKNTVTKLTALEWINGHDVALLMAANDDGTIKVWKPTYSPYNKEPILVSAWQALTDLQPAKSNSNAGVVMCWEQSTQTVITSGDVRIIRIWDSERELKDYDIPTSTDCSVTCIDSSYTNTNCTNFLTSNNDSNVSTPDDEGLVIKNELGTCDYVHRNREGLISVGFGDGSVRLFDRRCPPSEAKIRTWREHTSWVLGLQLKGDKIISGCLGGDVKIFDIRQNSSISVSQISSEMTALAVHRNGDTYACGSINPLISVHNLNGQALNTIRFYDGFMGHRTGPVSCLSFHPHRVALAAGTVDSSVSVYCINHKR